MPSTAASHRPSVFARPILLALAAAACDQPPPISYTPAQSESFMPAQAKDAKGKPVTDLHWVYAVNGGKPVEVTSGATLVTFTFGDQDVRVHEGGTRKTQRLSAQFVVTQGANRGTGVETVVQEDKIVLGPPAGVVERTETIDVSITSGGSGGAMRTLTMKPGMPVLDFADRADLDQLPVDYTEEADVTFKLGGNAIEIMGTQRSERPITGQARIHFRWRILEQLPSLKVRGKTYERVVKLEEETATTSTSSIPGTGTATSAIWVAKGIGIIKAEQSMNIDSIQARYFIELSDSNLHQP